MKTRYSKSTSAYKFRNEHRQAPAPKQSTETTRVKKKKEDKSLYQTLARPHEELEKVALQIDLEEIIEPAGGLYSIENPSTKTLTEYFGEYSIASKAYETFGEDLLFWEVARVSIEYKFGHPHPLAMPKNRTSFIIATYEGVKVD